MSNTFTSDDTSPSELLRLIRKLDPDAAVVPKDDGYYLKSNIRIVQGGRDLLEIATPLDAVTRTAADAVRVWWDLSVIDLSKAAYLAFGPNFYRFNDLGFWEQLSTETVTALDQRLVAVVHEEIQREMEEDARESARCRASIRSLQNPEPDHADAWRAGWKVGGMIGVLWAVLNRRR